MTTSPIKTVIKNLTKQKFTTPINSRLRIALAAREDKGDTAIIAGDVFSLMDRTQVAEALISAVLDKRVSLSYVIDQIADITENTGDPNINSSVAIRDRVALYNKDTKAKPVEVKQEPPAKQEETVKEEPATPPEPVAEPPKQEETVIVAETETRPTTPEEPAKPAEPVKEPAKPRKRQIKVN